MNKKIKKIIYCLLIVFFMLPTQKIKASSSYATVIKSMDTDIKVQENYSFQVTQKITADMGVYKHGLYIIIPYDKYNSIDIDSVKGPGSYETEKDQQDGKHFIKIIMGDEDEYLEGIKTWTIKYTIQGYKLDNKKDTIALSIVPAFWELKMQHTKTTITMPKAVKWDNLVMYSGSDGSKTSLLKDKHFKLVEKSDKKLVIEGKNLPQHYGASMRANLKSGYWEINTVSFPLKITIIFSLLAIILLVIWLKFGKDKKLVETVEFYPPTPNNLTPAELGYFIDGCIDNKDLISTFFYLADKGYVKIRLKNNKKDSKDETYVIERKKKISEDEPEYIKVLFKGMFTTKNKVFDPKNPPKKFTIAWDNAKRALSDIYDGKDNAIYEHKSKVLRIILLMILMIIMYMTGRSISHNYSFTYITIIKFIIGILFIFNFIVFNKIIYKKYTLTKKQLIFKKLIVLISSILLCICTTFLAYKPYNQPIFGIIIGLIIIFISYITAHIKRKNPKYLQLQGQIQGFRKFIKLAKIDQLQALIDENPNYFYNIIPYAYIFGLLKQWVNKFEDIQLEDTSWIDTNQLSIITAINSVADNFDDNTIQSTIDAITNSDSAGSSDSSNFSSSSGFGGGGGGSW